jgi:hypothetical protein
MKKELDKEEKFRRTNNKKNSFQSKGNGNFFNNFQILKKNKKIKCFSTKVIVNFVPTIKPKQSFCKPTFLNLNANKDSESKKEKKSFELEDISSCEEDDDSNSIQNSDESSYLSSSDSEKDIKEEENNINNSDKLIQKSTIFNLDDNKKKYSCFKQTKNVKFNLCKLEKDDDNDNGNKSVDMDEKNNKSNIFIRKEQTKIKFRTVIIKSQRDMEMIHNKIKKNLNQSIKKIRDIIDNGKENKNVVVNKNEDNANKNIVLPGKKISILDILSNKNKKKLNIL